MRGQNVSTMMLRSWYMSLEHCRRCNSPLGAQPNLSSRDSEERRSPYCHCWNKRASSRVACMSQYLMALFQGAFPAYQCRILQCTLGTATKDHKQDHSPAQRHHQSHATVPRCLQWSRSRKAWRGHCWKATDSRHWHMALRTAGLLSTGLLHLKHIHRHSIILFFFISVF